MGKIVLIMGSEHASQRAESAIDEVYIFAFSVLAVAEDAIARRIDSANHGWSFGKLKPLASSTQARLSLPMGNCTDWYAICAFQIDSDDAAEHVGAWLRGFSQAAFISSANSESRRDFLATKDSIIKRPMFNGNGNVKSISPDQISQARSIMSEAQDGSFESDSCKTFLITITKSFLERQKISFVQKL